MALVSKLEDENRRLRDQVQHKKDVDNKPEPPRTTEKISKENFTAHFEILIFEIGITREEVQCIKNLTEENLKLKRNIKLKDKELTQKTLDVEAVINLEFVLHIYIYD